MAKIGVLIAQNFEDVEYTKPAKAFKDSGHTLIHLGLKKNQTVNGKNRIASVKIDEKIGESEANQFDAIFIPGGCSPDNLRGEKEPVQFIKDFFETERPVLAICHAPQLLITAQLVKGKTMTCWKSVVQDLKNAGANYVNQEVVEDGNLITSRQPKDIPAFISASLNKLD